MRKKIMVLFLLIFTMLLSSCSVIINIIKDENFYGYLDAIGEIVPTTTPSTTPYVNSSPLHKKYNEDISFAKCMPASGDVNVLVIPVQIGNDKFTEEELNNINIAFNGTSEETGYESVKSYYYKASNKKLNITAEITPVYVTKKSKLYYDLIYKNDMMISFDILRNALHFLNRYYDFKNYDYNHDLVVDGVYMIYSCNYDNNDNSPWWAWCSSNRTFSTKLKVNRHVWASIDFIYEKNGNGDQIPVNASTYIHETGHLLGLNDYYDYNAILGTRTGSGGGLMMDHSVGDHDPFSKIMLGWSTPTVINKSGTYKLAPNVGSNECLLLPLRDYNNNLFNEYLLIDFYAPIDLNRFHKGTYGLFDKYGIRIFHVDARIDPNLGSPKNKADDAYFSIFSFNNSDTQYGILKLVEADKNNSVTNINLSENSDLFYQNSYLKNYINHSSKYTHFKLIVKNINFYQATIEITME